MPIIVSLNVASPPNRREPPKVNRQVMIQPIAPAMGPINRMMKNSVPPERVSSMFRFMECSNSMVMPKRAIKTTVTSGVVRSSNSRMAFPGSFQMRNQYALRVLTMIRSPFRLNFADDVFLRNRPEMAAVIAFNPLVAESEIMSFRHSESLDVLDIEIRRLSIGFRKHPPIDEDGVVKDGHPFAGEGDHPADVGGLFVFYTEDDDVSPMDGFHPLSHKIDSAVLQRRLHAVAYYPIKGIVRIENDKGRNDKHHHRPKGNPYLFQRSHPPRWKIITDSVVVIPSVSTAVPEKGENIQK